MFRTMSTSRKQGKGKAPMIDTISQGVETDEAKRIDQLLSGLKMMKNYYVNLKEKWSINAEARLRLTPSKMTSHGTAGHLEAHRLSGYDVMFTIRANIVGSIESIIHGRDLKFEACMWLDL
ncbi:hypothetical protein HAX54_050956, partial [Datura stramonium]|nr:hypothetical protein [Datura stramonium]